MLLYIKEKLKIISETANKEAPITTKGIPVLRAITNIVEIMKLYRITGSLSLPKSNLVE